MGQILRIPGNLNPAIRDDQMTLGFYVELRTGDTDDISDDYHTFGELYRYRMLLQAGWFNSIVHHRMQDKIVKSWRHSDGELCFGKDNYFIVMAQLPTGQISNHYKGEYWDLFDVPEVENAPEWDGHTPEEAADRIERYLKGDY